MENFTDLFGDDLSGLDGLGDFGNFAGSAAQPTESGSTEQSNLESSGGGGLMNTSSYNGSSYSAQKMSGYAEYPQYRMGLPQQQYYPPGYASSSSSSPTERSGYPPTYMMRPYGSPAYRPLEQGASRAMPSNWPSGYSMSSQYRLPNEPPYRPPQYGGDMSQMTYNGPPRGGSQIIPQGYSNQGYTPPMTPRYSSKSSSRQSSTSNYSYRGPGPFPEPPDFSRIQRNSNSGRGPSYRAPFPQASPSSSVSPRPMSPASSSSTQQSKSANNVHSSSSSLQQLEQMVMPGTPPPPSSTSPMPPKNPRSPSLIVRGSSPSQWSGHRQGGPPNMLPPLPSPSMPQNMHMMSQRMIGSVYHPMGGGKPASMSHMMSTQSPYPGMQPYNSSMSHMYQQQSLASSSTQQQQQQQQQQQPPSQPPPLPPSSSSSSISSSSSSAQPIPSPVSVQHHSSSSSPPPLTAPPCTESSNTNNSNINNGSAGVNESSSQEQQPDRDTSVVTPKLDEGEEEYLSEHCKADEPSSTDSLSSKQETKVEEPSSTTHDEESPTPDSESSSDKKEDFKNESVHHYQSSNLPPSVHSTPGHPPLGHPTPGHPTPGHPTPGHSIPGHPMPGHPSTVHQPPGHPSSVHPPSSVHQPSSHPSSGHPHLHSQHPSLPPQSMYPHHFGPRSEGPNGHMGMPPMRHPLDPRLHMAYPIQMELQHIHQQLNHLYNQPQSPQIGQQIQELQGRMQHLQGGPTHMAISHHDGGGGLMDKMDELEDDEYHRKGKRGPKPKKIKVPKPPKEKKPRKPKKGKDFDENEEGILISETSKKPKRVSKKKKLMEGADTEDFSYETSNTYEFEDEGAPSAAAPLPPPPPPPLPPSQPSIPSASFSPSILIPQSTAPPISTGGDPILVTDQIAESTKLKKPKVKITNTPKKPKPNKTLLQFAKKKRKRSDSGSDVDLDATPPPSPHEDDSTEKRRSGRNTKRKKYVDDVDLNLSEEDLSLLPPELTGHLKEEEIQEGQEDELASGENSNLDGTDALSAPTGPNYAFVDVNAEDTMIVQFILALRSGTRELESDEEDENMRLVYSDDEKAKLASGIIKKAPVGPVEKAKLARAAAGSLKISPKKIVAPTLSESKKSEKENKDQDSKPKRMIDVEEYLIKFKNFSYVHCQWLTEDELVRGDKRISQKIRRFKQKREKSGNMLDFVDDEPFNPDYVEVDRVLDISEHTDAISSAVTKHYLVKWRSLPYEDCTWELENDVDPIKIRDFERWRSPPAEEFFQRRRPRKDQWKKLETSPMYKNGNTLRPYQLEGVNWLTFSWYNGRNCLLADEMGLGKTIQSLAFLDAIFHYGIRGPFLVIAPLSTIPNWQREFELWSDMNVIVYHGSQTSRNMLSEYEMYYKDKRGERIEGVYKFHCLITTFECVITDILELREIKWRACCIDEAHRLKNKNCKLLEGLNLLDLESRLLLSGTPLQNNINELYSLLSFLEPAQFHCHEAFLKEFGDMQNEDQVKKLQAILKPLMLRRMKEDVEKSLKPKEETIVEVELTNMQKKYYRGILEKNFSFLCKGASNANLPKLMNTMMELRKCCIHPYLLNGAEEQIQEEYRTNVMDKNMESDPDVLYFNALTRSSGKMVLLDKLLPKLKEGGHRVLIFSQMVKMLDILEDYLIRKKYPFERIDGRIRGNLRQAAIDRYCRPDSDRFVFLLCTKAGGLGINLVAADTCIIYDSDWNPQNDLQAQARCHRIGQSKMVKIYRLVTRNTYEREMFDRASLKLGLDKAVLQSMNTNQGVKTTDKGGGNSLSKKEIEDLLKKGAYGAIMDDENAGDKFCEEDIEEILMRRTQTVTLENEKAGGSFSKASFASADTAADISIDDPDFWAKWAKKADVEEVDEKKSLMVSEPRSRKKIQRFGGHDRIDSRDVSDLDSSESDEEMLKSGAKSRRSSRRRRGFEYDEDYVDDDRDVNYGSWSKYELFRIEKSLMAFGWGRWEEILIHSNLRRGFNGSTIEDAARLTLLYCLNNYKGDEKIKTFIWELIIPQEFSGKGKKKSGKRKQEAPIEWVTGEKYDVDVCLDKSYRKHLDRHNNKILLRIRLLHYIRHDILGDLFQQINTPGFPVSDLGFYPPPCEGSPIGWWDAEADKSLLVGTYRHGYERYNMMRLDPDLCFLSRCGPPDSADIQEELKNAHSVDPDESSKLDDEEDSLGSKTPNSSAKADDCDSQTGQLRFPPASELNGRLRRLIASYQREFKKEEARQAAKDKRNERRERIEQVIRDREQQKMDTQQKKWTKKEENSFLHTIHAFGVEFSRTENHFIWDRFRALSKLDKKFDEALNEYYACFMAMIKKVLGMKLSDDEEKLQVTVETISEEKARKVIERIDFLNKIREDIINHPELDFRLDLCDKGLDLPEWWLPGKHDRDLLIGAAKHGLDHMEYYVLNDPELCFKDILQRQSKNESLVDKKEMAEFEERKQRDRDNEPQSLKTERRRKGSICISPPTMSQMEQMAKGGLLYDIEMMNELMAQSYAAAVKWPKDSILVLRLEHVTLAIETKKWPIPLDYSYGDNAENYSLFSAELTPDLRDTSTPMSEFSESSFDGGSSIVGRQRKRRKGPLDFSEDKSKIRSLLSTVESSSLRLNRSGVEITPVNGGDVDPILDLKKSAKSSKLESALDKIGLSKRKLSEDTKENKTKKKKRLDDIMFGLGAAKGVNLEKEAESEQNVLKKDKTDFSKLQDLLGPLAGSHPEAKVTKWLADQMGVIPERPITPSTAATATSTSMGKSPKSSFNPMEWMSSVSGDEHVTVFNRITGKKLSGNSGPKLKSLAQWLIDNPMFEVDPKWAEVVKNRESSDKRKFKNTEETKKSGSGGSGGVGPSFSTSGMAGLGLDPKNPMSALSALDPKNPMSLSTLYGLDPKKLDPVTAAMLGFGDPKNPMKMDPMMMAAMGLDPKTMSAMGFDTKALHNMDPIKDNTKGGGSLDSKLLQYMGIDPKLLAGLDPKILQSMGFNMDPKLMTQSLDPKLLGLDPKMLLSLGLDSKMLQAMGLDLKESKAQTNNIGFDQKSLNAMGLDQKTLQSLGLDQKSLKAMGLDSKTLQSLGLDSKMFQSLSGLSSPKAATSLPPMDSKTLQAMGLDSKTLQAMGLDPKLFQTLDPKWMGVDPKLLQAAGLDTNKGKQRSNVDAKEAMSNDLKKMDPAILTALGLDPKNPKIDPMTMAALGLDPKNLSGSLMSAMAMMDPNNSLAAMYGYGMMNPAAMGHLSGTDYFNSSSIGNYKNKTSSFSSGLKDSKSPRGSRASPSPRPPSRASVGSTDRKSPRTSCPTSSVSMANMSPKYSLSTSSLMNAASLGIDPKMLANMDPKLLHAAGLDPKSLLDPRFLLGGMDQKLANDAKMSLDLKSLGFDPKMFAGMDPKLLFGGMDPKLFGFDPRMFGMPTSSSTTSRTPSVSTGYDPRLQGLDLKMLQGLDSKALQRLGLDPKLVQSLLSSSSSHVSPKVPSKVSSASKSSTSTTYSSLDPRMFPGLDPKLAAAYGIDPKFFASLDPKTLGFDPKLLMDPKLFAGLDPKLLGFDAKTLAAYGLDPKTLSDPKLLSSGLMDPKLLSGLDPKLFDPKLLAGIDPNIAAMYGMGFSSTNGSSPKSSLGVALPPAKPKPGTVAAALAEKKKEAAAAVVTAAATANISDAESLIEEDEPLPPQPPHPPTEDDDEENMESTRAAEQSRKGLTSEERVLLREKKRERLMKEKDVSDGDEDGGGLNLTSSKKKKGKLESVLDKLSSSSSDNKSESHEETDLTMTSSDKNN